MTLGCHCQTLKRENIMSWFHRKEPKEAGMIDEIKQEVKKLSPLETEKDSYIYVQSILFKNGNQLAIEQNDIVVFVGPNNAGKSRSLRDVMDLARYNDYEGVVISKVSLHKGTLRDVVDYVCKNSKPKKKGGEIHYCGIGYEMTQEWMMIIVGAFAACSLVMWLGYFRDGKGTELWLPKSFSRFITRRAKYTNDNIEAFSLGMLSAFAEFPITLAIYFVVANCLLNVKLPLLAVLIYITIVSIPMVALKINIKTGKNIIAAQKWRIKNKRFAKFFSGSGFAVLAIFLIAFWVI